ncbi:MAG: PQQ-binding-like beta-propeller repeat protein [Phycisphaerae bacterium]|jgi:outer membrane protein assembly factor BamB|nr:PQQ-binding-like beta-propeller repeat protein [Phycisphaerae bacterium]
MTKKLLCLSVVLLTFVSARAGVVDQAKSSGIKGGLVVHLGCGDGKETAKLLLNDKYQVHGLAADDAKVLAARKNVHGAKVYGKVSIARYNPARLPYVDNLVNLLIDSSGGKVAKAEIMRVLVPGGAAFIGDKKVVKPWPEDIDQWTHFLHGPDNNAVAKDSKAGMPRSMQWVTEPRWGRTHEEMASMSAAVTANGRIFYIVDEAPMASIRFMSNWKLVARDAFNGTLLWKKPIAQWNDHLRHFRSGPAHLPRRLVAVGDTVYVTAGLASPVTALDAATGETIKVYKGTEHTEEIIVDGGVLYLAIGTSEKKRHGGGLAQRNEPKPTDFRRIAAINPDSGQQIWKKEFEKGVALLPLSLTVRGDKVYYQDTYGVACLDAKSGKELWKTARKTVSKRMGFSGPTIVATDDILLCADQDPGKISAATDKGIEWGVHGWSIGGFARGAKCTLIAYSTVNGEELWKAPCKEGYNSPVDVFVVGDKVWTGLGYQGLDIKTGKVAKSINVKGDRVGMPHPRCYRNKASERFIFLGRSGVELLSLEDGWLGNNSWLRGTCQYGIIPANGLLYAPPDACACFLTVKSPGFFAASAKRGETASMPVDDTPALEKGEAYAKIPASPVPQAGDWPMYRGNAARGGASSTDIPDKLKQQWSVSLGGKLTQPVIAGGKVFVATTDTHTVHALAADGGKSIWQYTAGGRIDSSPTIYKSTVLFGCADGWIYCLAAADGKLVWRFRAAPTERFVNAYGQLESLWPVHGAVLVQNDIIYATAGRSTYLDGGIVLYRIDPVSGKQLSKTLLYHLDPKTGKQLTREGGFNMEGTTSDVLAGDGELVYLKYFAFDRDGKRTKEASDHLFAIAGLLGEEWFVRSYWVVGKGMPGAGWGGWANAAKSNVAGRILSFNNDKIYGYGRKTVQGGAVGHKADAYHLFSRNRKTLAPKPTPAPRPKKPVAKGKKPPRRRRKPRPRPKPKGPPIWSDGKSLIVRSMVLGGDKLIVAGPVDLGKKTAKILAFENESEALAGFRGAKGIYLRTISAVDGKTISELKLTAMPTFDGMSAAGGKIYLSLRDGSVACFGK